MTFSMRRVTALCKKEIRDFSKNMNVFIICLLPLALSVVYSQMPAEYMGKGHVMSLSLTMNLVLVGSFAISMLIAEEKEKNTMRTLFLSSVSPMEFLLGKAIVIGTFLLVTNTAMFFLVGMELQHLLSYSLVACAVGFIMLVLGAVIGLIAENQMATGVVGMPLLMGFLMVPLFAELNTNLQRFANLIPTFHMQEMLHKLFIGNPLGTGYSMHIVAIAAWIVLSTLIFIYVYNKKGLDH